VSEGRPAPPVTVVVPGRSGRAPEVLAQAAVGQASERSSPPPRRRGGVLLLLVVLVLAVASVAGHQGDRPAPAPAAGVPQAVSDVQATAQLLSQDARQVQLLVEVRIAAEPATTGLPGSAAPSAQVRLLGISAPGLAVRLGDRPPPLLLGYVGRFGPGREQVVRLTVDVVALGCAAPEPARRLTAALRRSTASSDADSTVLIRDRPEVTQALEALVRRSCGGAGRTRTGTGTTAPRGPHEPASVESGPPRSSWATATRSHHS
jgi:hypothetical protein